MTLVQLDPAQVKEIVERTAARANELVLANLLELRAEAHAERAERRPAYPPDLVDAQTLARTLGCSRDCVYAHAEELGGRIGNSPCGRLRFDLDHALEAWSARPHSKESQAPDAPATSGRSVHRRRKRMGSGPELLPIKGSERP